MTLTKLKELRTRCETVAKNKMNVLLVNCQDMSECLDEIERLATDRDAWKAEAERLIALMAETCTWTYQGGIATLTDDNDCFWDTECGEAYMAIEGGLANNRIKFCVFCGKAIREIEEPSL